MISLEYSLLIYYLYFDNLHLREVLKVFLSDQMSSKSLNRFMSATCHLLPCLMQCISASYERDIIRRCLGIFTKLMSNYENVVIFGRTCPDHLLSSLIQLIWSNITSTETISTYSPPAPSDAVGIDPIPSLPVYMLSDALPACSGDFLEFNDVEIRDMALDAVRALCAHPDPLVIPHGGVSTGGTIAPQGLSHWGGGGVNKRGGGNANNKGGGGEDKKKRPSPFPSLKQRIGSHPMLFRVLSNIICTGGRTSKSEGYNRALTLLSLLSAHNANRTRCHGVQMQLCLAAMADEAIAGTPLLSSHRSDAIHDYMFVFFFFCLTLLNVIDGIVQSHMKHILHDNSALGGDALLPDLPVI
jgi:hypothetical protein